MRLSVLMFVCLLFSFSSSWTEDIVVFTDPESLQRQIEAGYDLNKLNEFEQTPLMEAAFWNTIENARILVRAGANVRKRNRFGKSAIFYAAIYGRLEIAKLLVQSGASTRLLDAKDNENYTPLHLAALNGKVDVVKYLLSLGADVNNVNVKGRSILSSVLNAELPVNNESDIKAVLIRHGAIEISRFSEKEEN